MLRCQLLPTLPFGCSFLKKLLLLVHTDEGSQIENVETSHSSKAVQFFDENESADEVKDSIAMNLDKTFAAEGKNTIIAPTIFSTAPNRYAMLCHMLEGI